MTKTMNRRNFIQNTTLAGMALTLPFNSAKFSKVRIGVIGTAGQFVVTEALKLADTTALMPFDFFKLIWAAVLGVVLFGEHPDVYTWIGAAIVFGSSFYIAWRETMLRREKKVVQA